MVCLNNIPWCLIVYQTNVFFLEGEVVPEYIRRSEFLYRIDHDHPLRKLVLGCLANKPGSRPTAEDIVNQLKPLNDEYPVTHLPAPSVDEDRVGAGVNGSFMPDLQDDDYDFKFKVLVIGQQGVGKTSIIERLANPAVEFQDLFGSEHFRFDEHFQQVRILGKWVHLQVVEYKAQESSNSVPMIFRDVNGAVVIFDLCDKASFSTVGEWVEIVRKRCGARTPIVLVGNKNDMDTRKVSAESVQDFAVRNDLLYLDASAKTSCNVDNAFAFLVGKLIQPQEQTKSIWDLQRHFASPIRDRQYASPVPSVDGAMIVMPENKPLVAAEPKKNIFRRHCCW